MQRVITILLALLTCSTAWGQSHEAESTKVQQQTADVAQQPTELAFESLVCDFGRINEVDGPVSHTFTFANNFDHPISIERVYTSCGCTTTNYSRKPVLPGKQGQFTIEFDPEGREGKFDKKVTIVYNNGECRTHLRVKGKVIGRPRSVADLYPRNLGGGVRADMDYKAFGQIAQGKTRSMTIALINTNDTEVSLNYVWLEASGLLEVNMPTELAPEEVALATLTYDIRDARYGLLRDRLGILVNGEQTDHEIVATAIGVDNFEESDNDKRPRAIIDPVYHDFGNAQKGEQLVVEVSITNNGSASLEVRSVVPREGTTITLRAGDSIAPGQTKLVEMTYVVPIEGYDTVFGGAMVVVNDPLRPVRELRVAANVIK